MFNKILLSSVLTLTMLTSTYAANEGSYSKVDCALNSSFWEYSCNECFDWWILKVWQKLDMNNDIWVNKIENWVKQIIFKEEQKMPVMNNLNGSVFLKKPDNDTFWQYTSDLEAFKDTTLNWYVLPAWQSVKWLESSNWAAYMVDKLGTSWANAWVLVYDLVTHNILPNWEVDTTNSKKHRECVLYKAWDAPVVVTPENVKPETVKPEPKPVTPKPKVLPTAGPEAYFLVIIISMLFSMLILNRKFILERIKK